MIISTRFFVLKNFTNFDLEQILLDIKFLAVYNSIAKKIYRGKVMKKEIHPDYKKTVIKCVCGNEIETGSVVENLTVEICNNCHPFYTGNQKIVDTEGRIEKFKKRYQQK